MAHHKRSKESLSKEREESKEKHRERKSHSHRDRSHKKRTKSNSIMKGFAWGLLGGFLNLVHFFFDKFIQFCLEQYWGSKRQCPELKANYFITKSAVELAHMIRAKAITSHQVVKAYIDRLNEVNPVINAVVDGPFQEALEEAKAIDQMIARGQISEAEFSEKPFLGIPFSTKDSTAVKDKLHTLGIISRRNLKAKEDAECIALMKQAGAIIICTSNIPEINRWQETRNNIIGQTNNPYDTRRTVGGSSGGEAALIASCASAFGIGTDIGGSIRMPAFYTGIFGHKPSVGIVNTRGCTLRTGKEQSSMVVAGPMARYAKDLSVILEVLAGPSLSDTLKLKEPVDLQKLRYFYITESGDMRCSKIESALNKAMGRVVDHFHNMGENPVQNVKLSGTESSAKMWRYWMTQEPANFSNLLGNGVKVNPLLELPKLLVGRSEYTLASMFSLIDELLPKEKEAKIREITRKCDEELTELLGDDGILFYPSTTHSAPFHFAAFFQIYNFSYWSIFNVLHVPVTQVPLGLSSEGLPLGIQVVSTRNNDRLCLAVAEELEKVFGGYVTPFTTVK